MSCDKREFRMPVMIMMRMEELKQDNIGYSQVWQADLYWLMESETKVGMLKIPGGRRQFSEQARGVRPRTTLLISPLTTVTLPQYTCLSALTDDAGWSILSLPYYLLPCILLLAPLSLSHHPYLHLFTDKRERDSNSASGTVAH